MSLTVFFSVFASVIGSLGTFALAALGTWGLVIKSRWYKLRKADQQRQRTEKETAEAKRHEEQDAMRELVMAQLNTNGGGSFLDKMNATRADVGELKESSHTMSSQMQGLEKKADVLQAAADGLQVMADDLKESLPKALGVQDELVRDVHSLTERMDRVEAELFGD